MARVLTEEIIEALGRLPGTNEVLVVDPSFAEWLAHGVFVHDESGTRSLDGWLADRDPSTT